MTQRGAVFVGPHVVEVELPEPTHEVLPGLSWGAIEAFPTPAYWAYQVFARRILSGAPHHRLGRTLAEEVAACVLGGHGIQSQVGIAAFRHLRRLGLLDGAPAEDAIRQALFEPIAVGGRNVRYRFAAKKSAYLARALGVLATETPPDNDGLTLRNWLLRLDGVGYKTASWIARNWLDADNVAILDVHVVRAGRLGGFLDERLDVARNYIALEEQFLGFSNAIGVRASELDAVIWQEMMSSPLTVWRLMGDGRRERSGSLHSSHLARQSDKSKTDAMQTSLLD